ncbi:hypothetical protein D932_01341 [Enterococcus casseliflavus 14-MB-W-14]|nr:hypothetical protein D932_01341 [Enterococcus casseliflavus 14-MB-W-14]
MKNEKNLIFRYSFLSLITHKKFLLLAKKQKTTVLFFTVVFYANER